MFKKVKNFVKYNSIASLYLCLFILAQSFILLGLFYYNVMNNLEFQDKFVEVFLPIYDNPDFNYFTSSMEVMDAYMGLMSDLITPTLLFSNLAIVIIVGLKMFFSRKKETAIKKISLNETFKYVCLGIVLNLVISSIISLLPADLIASHSSATEGVLNGNIWILILSSGILAPISEELICRYGMQKNLVKINPIFGVVYQALIFGLLHGNLVQSSYAFILGLIFGIIVYKKGNLLYSIILHLSINTSSVIVSCLGINELLGMLAMIVLFFVLFLLTKNKVSIDMEETTDNIINIEESQE